MTFVIETNLDSSVFFCFLSHGTIYNLYNPSYLSLKKPIKHFFHCYLFKESDIMGLSAMQFRKEKWILPFSSPVVVIRPGEGAAKTVR